MIVTTDEEVRILREGGKRLAHILHTVATFVVPGVDTAELDQRAYTLTTDAGDTPAFLNYRPEAHSRPYPASLCVSINDEIVHGIPNEEQKIIKDGDVVVLDFGLQHEGLFTDSAITVIAGVCDEAALHLVETTKRALDRALEHARTGSRLGDIGNAVWETARTNGLTVFRDLAGHGVGKSVHEPPFVPNFGKRGRGEVLVEGLVIAIEPIFGEGDEAIKLASDGHTYVTVDGSRSAHFEHTVIIRKDGPEILTKVT